jgi:predicted transcriptional regulator
MLPNRDPRRDAPCGDSSYDHLASYISPHEHFDAMTAATIEPYSRPLTLQSFLRHFSSASVCREQDGQEQRM